jgi:predicted MFS family arabinose efflux permease
MTGRRERPLHDAPTWISYAQISLFSFFITGFGATQALLRDEQMTSRTVSGLHAACYAAANVLSALAIPYVITRIGRGTALRIGVIGMCIGLAIYTGPGGLIASLTGVTLIGVFGTVIIVGSNAFILDHQKGAGPASITEGNAFAAVTGFIAPLVIGIGAATFLGWRVGLWVLIIGLAVSEVFRSRWAGAYLVPPEVLVLETTHARPPRKFWWSLMLGALLVATEFTFLLWSADLLRDRVGLSAEAAAAALAAVTGGMLIGRIIGARLAETRPIDLLLRTGIAVTLIGFVIAWFSLSIVMVLIGLFIVGLGLSVNWPLGVARSVRASGGLTDKASGLASAWGGVALGTAPFALGLLSDRFSVHTAFLIIPVLMIAAFTILTLSPLRERAEAGVG